MRAVRGAHHTSLAFRTGCDRPRYHLAVQSNLGQNELVRGLPAAALLPNATLRRYHNGATCRMPCRNRSCSQKAVESVALTCKPTRGAGRVQRSDRAAGAWQAAGLAAWVAAAAGPRHFRHCSGGGQNKGDHLLLPPHVSCLQCNTCTALVINNPYRISAQPGSFASGCPPGTIMRRRETVPALPDSMLQRWCTSSTLPAVGSATGQPRSTGAQRRTSVALGSCQSLTVCMSVLRLVPPAVQLHRLQQCVTWGSNREWCSIPSAGEPMGTCPINNRQKPS